MNVAIHLYDTYKHNNSYTVNDKNYAREKLHGLSEFSMNHKSFPYRKALNNGSTFNTDEAKLQK